MTDENLSNAVGAAHLSGTDPTDEKLWLPGEDLCGCDGIPCRLNRVVEDGENTCGSCELPCHSVENYEP